MAIKLLQPSKKKKSEEDEFLGDEDPDEPVNPDVPEEPETPEEPEPEPEPVYDFDDNNYDENEYVSDEIDREEERGFWHFIAYLDGNGLYVFDPVRKTIPMRVLNNLKNPTHVAIDGFRNYIFVSEEDPISKESVVNGYKIHTDVTNVTYPSVYQVREANVTQAYKGGKVSGLAVDDIRGFLYIADTGKSMILIYDFDRRSMRKHNQT